MKQPSTVLRRKSLHYINWYLDCFSDVWRKDLDIMLGYEQDPKDPRGKKNNEGNEDLSEGVGKCAAPKEVGVDSGDHRNNVSVSPTPPSSSKSSLEWKGSRKKLKRTMTVKTLFSKKSRL